MKPAATVVLPVFLTETLGAKPTILGLIEGIAQALQNIVQGFSGWLSDKLQRRKPVALVGYFVSALSKPFMGAGDAEQLRRDFALDPHTKVKHLSRGQRSRAGLVAALAYRPDLLVLDEPSSGLDPIVRRDILGAVIRTIAHEGRTVLFSSHLLDEVEQVADHVAMIRAGRIVLSAPLEDIKRTHRTLDDAFHAHVGKAASSDAVAWE